MVLERDPQTGFSSGLGHIVIGQPSGKPRPTDPPLQKKKILGGFHGMHWVLWMQWVLVGLDRGFLSLDDSAIHKASGSFLQNRMDNQDCRVSLFGGPGGGCGSWVS